MLGQDPRLQPDPLDRRLGRGVRPLAVHRRDGRDGVRHGRANLFGPAIGPPALYAVVAMGGVFAAAAQAPLTAIASVAEMTGNFGLTLPIMLACGIAAALSKQLTYGNIYTTKLLRRGIDIERPKTTSALQRLTVARRHAAHPTPRRSPAAPAIAGAPGRTRRDSRRAVGALVRPRNRHPPTPRAVRRGDTRTGATAAHRSTTTTGCRWSPTTGSTSQAGSPARTCSKRSPTARAHPPPRSSTAPSPLTSPPKTPKHSPTRPAHHSVATRSSRSPSPPNRPRSAGRPATSPGHPEA